MSYVHTATAILAYIYAYYSHVLHIVMVQLIMAVNANLVNSEHSVFLFRFKDFQVHNTFTWLRTCEQQTFIWLYTRAYSLLDAVKCMFYFFVLLFLCTMKNNMHICICGICLND